MPKRGKKYLAAKKAVEEKDRYTLKEAIEKVKEIAFAGFDESVEMAVRLGVDPRHADRMVRGSVLLPHGTGKEVKVLVFAKGEKEQEAREAGADYVGAEDMAEKIQKEGWLDFDRAIATPDMMSVVGKLGRILGPRGLMPNPKTGTVTMNVKEAVEEIKKGKVDYKVDRAANIHVVVGKVSFDSDKLYDNARAVLDSIQRAKPASAKGTYFKNITLSPTMGPGVKVDVSSALDEI